MYYKDGFSASPIISKKIESHLWDDYRYYLFIKKCVQNFGTINIPNSINLSIKKVSKYFKDSLNFYNNNIYPNDLYRTKLDKLGINRLSKYANLVQIITPKKKIIYIKDLFTYKDFKNKKNFLILNNINPRKGYYFKESVTCIRK